MKRMWIIAAVCGSACLVLCVYLVVIGVTGGQTDGQEPDGNSWRVAVSGGPRGAGSDAPGSQPAHVPAPGDGRSAGPPVPSLGSHARSSSIGDEDSTIPPQPEPPSAKAGEPGGNASIRALLDRLADPRLPYEQVSEIVAQLAREGDQIVDSLMADYRKHASNGEFRHRIIIVLGRIATPVARQALLDITKVNEVTANRGLAAAGFISTSPDRADVQKLLDSFDPMVQFVALGYIKTLDDEHHKKVLALAESNNGEVRWAALQILGREVAATRAEAELAAVLHSFQTADSVEKRPVVYSSKFLLSPGESHADKTRSICIGVLRNGRWSTEALAKAQTGLSGSSLDAVIIARARRGDKAVHDELRGIVQRQQENWICVWAIEALSGIGSADDLPLLKQVAEKTQWKVRIDTEPDGSPKSYYPIRSAAERVQQQIQKASGK